MKRGNRRTGGRVPVAALRIRGVIHGLDGSARAMLAQVRSAGARG